jgi:LysM repeat protein
MKNYTVQTGDTLFAIAAREYGDGGLYPVIAQQNHLTNPNLILAGQELLIPYVTFRHLVAAADSTAARNQITQQYYGTSDPQVQLIWEIVNGVAQRETQRGAWLQSRTSPMSATTPWWRTRRSKDWRPDGTATTTSRR